MVSISIPNSSTHCKNLIDVPFDVWCGGFATSDICMMACVSISGHHSICDYLWQCNGLDLEQTTPLLYTSLEGVFACHVTCQQLDVLQGNLKFPVGTKIMIQ